MKVVILAGGRGTRISEETEVLPKPMVEIGGKPVIWHIMKLYSHYGFNDFIICLGYRGYMIKEYFSHYFMHMSDVTIDLKKNAVKVHTTSSEPWKVTLVDTGLETMTGGRLKRLASMINQETFMMTYGDGVSNVNLDALLKFHKTNKGLVTLTAVRPPARFGALEFEGNQIRHFKEKSTLHEGWINGGFFVVNSEALSYIKEKEDVMWEHAPMEKLAEEGKLFAYKHEGFWQCMDTARDLKYLEDVWQTGNAPWKTW